MAKKLGLAMIGGGKGAFIGAVHRCAAMMDGEFELVAGAFSSRPEMSRESGQDLGLDPSRVYGSYDELIEVERQLPVSERVRCISVVTPNHTHFDIADKALKAGFHVICDKPITHSLADAIKLQQTVAATGQLFALTHNYTGYPLVKEARDIIRSDQIGKVRKFIVEYSQGWLATPLESEGDIWRTDPERSGISGCMGDIGTHAFNLLEYVTGDKVTQVSAELTTFVPGRLLDDDGNVLVRMSGGARGVLLASQVCIGEENNLNLRVYGDRGGINWQQQLPNQLILTTLEGNDQVLRAGANHRLGANALANSRLPGGHPEGFIEAFANIYREFASAIRARDEGRDIQPDLPTVHDGVRSMAFLEALVENSRGKSKWTQVVV